MNTVEIMGILMRVLQTRSFNYADEKLCQIEIEQLLQDKGITYLREHNFGDGVGVCDFLLPRSGIVLEAKAFKTWSKKEVFRQCERYCSRSEVNGLLLATGKAQGLPDTIGGKPARVYLLGLGAL